MHRNHKKLAIGQSNIRTKIKPRLIRLHVIVLMDGFISFYTIVKDGIKFNWEPLPQDETDLLPPFTIWRNGDEWIVEATDKSRIDIDVVQQIMKNLFVYFQKHIG